MNMEIWGFELSVTWMLVVGVMVMLALYDWWCHQYFQRLGIPVASYIPIFGNILQWRHGFHQSFSDFAKKYGKVFGMYDFRRPVLIITDPVILKNVLVKNFSCFTNRRDLPLKQKPLEKGMIRLKNEAWKEVRNVITPSFSAAKMRLMSPMINECCDTMVANIIKAQEGGKAVNCRQLFGAFTMDVIAKCGFGLDVDSQKNKDDPFLKHAKKAAEFSFFQPAFMIASIFPVFGPILDFLGCGFLDTKASKFFSEVTMAACKMRKEEGEHAPKRVDMLQLMLNAHNDTENEDDTTQSMETDKGGAVHRKVLSTDEVMAQSVIFFQAGYETTNALLSFAAFVLATNHDVQEKLHAEIDDIAPTRDNLGYDAISKMEYLDMVVNETLRMYPPGTIFDRMCNETISYDGLTIEKGVDVFVVVWAIHHNEEYWPSPSKFDPTRFSAENKGSIQPCTFLPFGFGPRNCIGMRFALLVAKMALVRVLQQYRFDVCSETEIPLTLAKMGLAPKTLYIRAVART